jgi:hypothetical protein
MNELLTNAGSLIGIAYTIALLGHILYRGFIRETDAARFAARRMK